MQTTGDCKEARCDAVGGVVNPADDTDLPPTPTNQCAMAACNAGTPEFPARPHGTLCSQDGGRTCDNATATCITSFSVLRYLTASDTSGNASALVIEERKVDATGTLVKTTTLPTADMMMGTTQHYQIAGVANSNSEGELALSGNGKFLIVAGYDANPGATTPLTADRIIGRVSAAGAVDTSTRLPVSMSYAGDNTRGATSQDGTAFWASGASTGTTGGIWYVVLGAQSGTQLLTTNTRWAHVFNGQLWAASNTGSIFYPNKIGTGLPTSGSQTAMAQPGLPTSGTPHGYVFFDRNPSVDGPDLLYVADAAAASGIRRWRLPSNGGTWTLDGATTNFNISPASGFKGVTGYVNSNNDIVLIATTAARAGNQIVRWTDVGGTSTPANNGSMMVTAPAGEGFRGVALSPNL
jgi:hypothetical protein